MCEKVGKKEEMTMCNVVKGQTGGRDGKEEALNQYLSCYQLNLRLHQSALKL